MEFFRLCMYALFGRLLIRLEASHTKADDYLHSSRQHQSAHYCFWRSANEARAVRALSTPGVQSVPHHDDLTCLIHTRTPPPQGTHRPYLYPTYVYTYMYLYTYHQIYMTSEYQLLWTAPYTDITLTTPPLPTKRTTRTGGSTHPGGKRCCLRLSLLLPPGLFVLHTRCILGTEM